MATIREIFRADVINAYIEHLDRIYQEGEEEARDNVGLFKDDYVVSDPAEWSKEAERLDRLKELLIAPQLGTS